MVALEIAVVLILFVVNGLFAMAELAIISSRRAHLERLIKEGKSGARTALKLADEPARMLAAVQVGFTTTATLAGIFSGATLAERLSDALLLVPGLADYTGTESKPCAVSRLLHLFRVTGRYRAADGKKSCANGHHLIAGGRKLHPQRG